MNTAKNVRKERGANETGGENTTRKQKTIKHGKYAAGIVGNPTTELGQNNANVTTGTQRFA
ncbi:MAG: hypothetical protein Q8M83_04805 [bacterium]|nr:hypothetical protein [bacterium]